MDSKVKIPALVASGIAFLAAVLGYFGIEFGMELRDSITAVVTVVLVALVGWLTPRKKSDTSKEPVS